MVTKICKNCDFNTSEFRSLFEITKGKCNKTDEMVNLIFNEFKQTRLHFGSIGTMFKTFAGIKNVKQKNIPTSWDIVKKFLGNFPIDQLDYKKLDEELSKKILDAEQKKCVIDATKLLHDKSKETLNANVKSLRQTTERKIGLIGEMFSFLYSRDVHQARCIFHKLIPDNPSSTRPGLDLLAIQFANNPDNDQVHFWESKCTLTDFDGQRYKIVQWFNTEKEKKYLSNVIEAARMLWEKSLSAEDFERANIALSKFQANKQNFKFIGSIAYDMTIIPKDESIAKFDDVKVPKNNKNLILFNTEKLEDMVNEVYDRTCVE